MLMIFFSQMEKNSFPIAFKWAITAPDGFGKHKKKENNNKNI
jgi:hypothetical protein